MSVDISSGQVFPDDDLTWGEFFAEGGASCTFCDALVNDPRYAVGLEIRRSFSSGSTDYRFCHIECLRKAMHHKHPLG